MTYERVRQIFFFFFVVHSVMKHCLNRYLPDEIIWPVIRRKELSLPPKDIRSLRIMVAFSLQAANQSTQATGQLHASKKLSKKESNYILSSIFCSKSIPLWSTNTKMWICKPACACTHTKKPSTKWRFLFLVLKYFYNKLCSLWNSRA